MTTWNGYCRVCGNPAEYGIFGKIPVYLHASLNEYVKWQKPINIMLEDTTGLKVSENDGLPQHICALCISYLKHAMIFREQAIKNALHLKEINGGNQLNAQQKGEKTQTSTAKPETLVIQESRPSNSNVLLNNAQSDLNKNTDQEMRYPNVLFYKDTNAKQSNTTNSKTFDAPIIPSLSNNYFDDYQTPTSSEDNEQGMLLQPNIFSYREKNFEEDDIFDQLRDSIIINIPESCKERKCRACFRRFMFEESYKEHVRTCIEMQFLEYIETLNRLLEIRKTKTISPHEFIRRVIFYMRRTCNWVKANYNEGSIPNVSELNNFVDLIGAESDGKSSAYTSSGEQKVQHSLIELNDEPNYSEDANAVNTLLSTNNEDNLLFQTVKQAVIQKSPININNNILYKIERAISPGLVKPVEVVANSSNYLKKPIPVLGTNVTANGATVLSSQKHTVYKCKTENTLPDNGPSTSSNIFGTAQTMQTINRSNIPVVNDDSTFLQNFPNFYSNQSPTVAMILKNEPNGEIDNDDNKPNIALTIQTSSPAAANFPFSARCNPCDLTFLSVASLELHNASCHNHNHNYKDPETPAKSSRKDRKQIIAMFEDVSDDEEEEEEEEED
ncbi:uncharacterized protein LOC119688380 isoform X2 [Teleopsis dalmanni]|uniref:uncharacterized protein LOC119688380 isoform X2 n=1 Tax=Teleopsis dalmanni TaxID=139649 RepID=UPI0018CF54C4|nr:uncharacterized protein LOC119688380 isoform X2 [Teleopsis dalmanni]